MANESDTLADDAGAELLDEAADAADRTPETAATAEQVDRLLAVLRMKGIVSEAGAEYVKTGDLDTEQFFGGVTFEEMEPLLVEMQAKGKCTEAALDRWKGFLGAE